MSAVGEERRRQLIATAAELFDNGYHTTSVEDVARAVGIRKPTIYHYFGGKEEILFGIHEEFIDVLISREAERAEAGLTAPEHLLAIMGDILDLMESHRGHVRVFFEHYRELSAPRRKKIKAKRDAYEASVKAVIQRGVDAKELRPVNVDLATLALAGMCNWAYQWFNPEGPQTTRQVAEEFFGFLMHGIAAPAKR
jgi:AcrR family transcriptional regulator